MNMGDDFKSSVQERLEALRVVLQEQLDFCGLALASVSSAKRFSATIDPLMREEEIGIYVQPDVAIDHIIRVLVITPVDETRFSLREESQPQEGNYITVPGDQIWEIAYQALKDAHMKPDERKAVEELFLGIEANEAVLKL